MLDNPLITLLIAQMKLGFQTIGQSSIAAIPIMQSSQPIQQGANTAPTVYLQKIFDHRYGSPGRVDVWTPSTVASFTGWISNNILNVTAVASGVIAVNEAIEGANIPANTLITSLGNGTGGTGTYNLNQTLNIPSEAMTAIAGEVHTEIQQYESTFQISTLATQDPANQNQLTASDIANFTSAILQSDAMISALEAQGVGILRITDIRNTYFTDDRERFEASPTFDFVVTHKQVITTIVPIITAEVFQVLPV